MACPTRLGITGSITGRVSLIVASLGDPGADFYIQDATAGIHIRGVQRRDIAAGDSVVVMGTVEPRHTDTSIRLTTSDTGIGMNAGFLSDLISEFRQETEGEARNHEGTGLGMAITLELSDLGAVGGVRRWS